MIHILVPGRYLDWHMLACAPLQSIESINSILEVGSSAATAGFHDTDSGQCLFRTNVPDLTSSVDCHYAKLYWLPLFCPRSRSVVGIIELL
jgi:hypothetical protein